METIQEVDVRHFKLTNGENIICYVQSATEHAFIVERPAARAGFTCRYMDF